VGNLGGYSLFGRIKGVIILSGSPLMIFKGLAFVNYIFLTTRTTKNGGKMGDKTPKFYIISFF
jgi:hypothetical protein